MAGYVAAGSVETDDLALFCENGERYVRSLSAIASAVVDARRRVVSVGDERNDTTSEIHDYYVDGQDLIDRNKMPENEEEIKHLIQGWVDVPEQGAG